jgi:predicted aspartyl protease
MRKNVTNLLWVISLALVITGCQRHADKNAINSLKHLLAKKDYFKLASKLKDYEDKLDDQQKLYFSAYTDNAFNRNLDCVKDVDSLLKNYASRLTDSDKRDLTLLQSDSYFKLYQYAKAGQNDSIVLKNYSKVLSKDETDDIKNYVLIRTALKNTAPQETIIKSNTTLQWTKNKIGLVEIPVKANNTIFSGIFDTRANISTVTQTYAKKMGLRILDVSYTEGSGATGIQFKTGMGIADSIYLGDILVKNVVFQVMPDSILYIAPIKYQLNMIVGFPVIEQLREVHIFKDGRMTIPAAPTQSGLHNFALDGLDPVIALKVGNDTLPFHFDSGASTSMLYQAYFDKYKAEVLKNGLKKIVGFGGAGGMQKKEVYILPKLNMEIGDKVVTIDSVSVLQKKITPAEVFFGNIGQDLTNQFNEVIYNFKYMYVKCR